MSVAISFLLVVCFLLSTTALLFLIWSISHRQFQMGPGAAEVIFERGEVGTVEEPASSDSHRLAERAEGRVDEGYVSERKRLDRSSRTPVLWMLSSAVVWLVLGSLAGLVVSIKFHQPDWLTQQAWLTFGRLRPVHLNAVIYGWTSMAGVGVSLWLMPRLLKTELRGIRWATAGAIIWNLGVALGLVALALGGSEGQEWLEFPWPVDLILVVAGACLGVPLLLTLKHRRVEHLYVSTWYIGAALLWFPFLFGIANLPHLFTGVSQAIVNWWFAHNVLGLWITPMALSAAYYFIPKVLGRPIYSYQLSLLGFWSLALFYSQAGIHHLIGGPVPTWLVAISVVHSVSMFVPVIAVAVNHHMTLKGRFSTLKSSPTLRFVVVGAILYTLVSLQGSLEALRSVNRVVHFTHYTVAHAHLGVYGFATFIYFGSYYFIMPRLLGRNWPYPKLINWHFGLCLGGLLLYFVSMTYAGWLQGLALLQPDKSFLHSLEVTKPFLAWRTVGGTLMTLGHLIFAFHYASLFRTAKESA